MKSVGIAVVIVKPTLHSLPPRLVADVNRKLIFAFCAPLHGFPPLVVTLHPAEVGVFHVLQAEIARIGLPAIGFHTGSPVVVKHGGFVAVALRHEPREVTREAVSLVLGLPAAHGVDFVTPHVAHAGSRATRAAALIEHRTEETRLNVVHMVWQFVRCRF